MLNQQYTGRNGNYTTSRLLGKGGEGEVYELTNRSDQVLKLYTETLHQKKAAKLQLMVGRHSAQMQTYAAWPTDIVTDKKGFPCGFVMKKLDNYVPLHMLFSPMDRKKIFPDKGYNFLVHVARNVAAAFHTMHAAGMVIGDVNEGNLLVNNQGMVAFIDCDSFQLSDGNQYYFCEVGVPRYTPPELLKLPTFENVVRTVHTDSFSMAVLIFQLLFLGRHPFAGINHTQEDIGEELAIQRQIFAYSLHNQQKHLSPPKDSFDISKLPANIVQLFHDAFESTGNRPSPAQWIQVTNQMLQQMNTCSKSKLHSYPNSMNQCPWCEFRNKRNILYFIDDIHSTETSISKDFDQFIQGFRVEQIYIPEPDLKVPAGVTYTPAPPGKKIKAYRGLQTAVTVLLLAASIVLFSINTITGFLLLLVTGLIYMGLPWKIGVHAELKQRKERLEQLSQKLSVLVTTYHGKMDVEAYQQTGKKITQLISQYTQAPKEIQLKKRAEEERLYNHQLHTFLQQYSLKDYHITNFGHTRKQALYDAGIITASDISRLGNIKVPGIGGKYESMLFSWQRQVASSFIYHPDNNLLNKTFLKLLDDAEQRKKNLEQNIRSEYRNLQQMKQHIIAKRSQIQVHIDDLKKQIGQAQADLQVFKQQVK